MKNAFCYRNSEIIEFFIFKEPILYEKNKIKLINFLASNYNLKNKENLFKIIFNNNKIIQEYINSAGVCNKKFTESFIDFMLSLDDGNFDVNILFDKCYDREYLECCDKLLNDKFQLNKEKENVNNKKRCLH